MERAWTVEEIELESPRRAQNNMSPNEKKSKGCKVFKYVVAFAVILCLTVTAGVIGFKYPNNDSSDAKTLQNRNTNYSYATLQQKQSLGTTKGLLDIIGKQVNVAIRNDFLLQDCFNGNLKKSFPDIDYALFGYHIMKGFPWSYGHDPGLTDPIFKADYSDRLQTADCKFSIPAGYVVVPDVSCDLSFSSTEIKNKDELKSAVQNSAKADLGIPVGQSVELGFSASHEFNQMSQQLGSSQKVIVVSTATCQSYYVKLKMEKPSPFSESFIIWLEKLANAASYKETDLNVYLEFIDKYGTHFLKEVKFGARFIKQYSMTNENYKKIRDVQKGTSVGVHASAMSKLNIGGSFSRSEKEDKLVESFNQNVESRTITIGSAPPASGEAQEWASLVQQTPVPFSYIIEPITTIFDRVFMKQYPHIDATKIKKTLQDILTKKSEIIRQRVTSWKYSCRIYSKRFDLKEDICLKKQSKDVGDIEYDRCYQDCLDEPGCEGTNIFIRTDKNQKLRSCIFYSSKYNELPADKFNLLINETTTAYEQHCKSSVFPIKIQEDTKAYTNSQKAGKLFLRNLAVSSYEITQSVDCSSDGTFEKSQRCADLCITDTKQECVFSYQKLNSWPNEYCCYLGTEDQANSLKMTYSYNSDDYLAFIKTCSQGI